MAAKGRKFEDDLRDLEELVNRIDSGELTLEESISAFERGVGLVKALNQKLDEVERKVEVLTRDAGGELRSEPFESDLGGDAGNGGEDDDDLPR